MLTPLTRLANDKDNVSNFLFLRTLMVCYLLTSSNDGE